MIVSVHIVDAGLSRMPTAPRHKPRSEATPGLLYAETTVTAPQDGGGRLPLYPGRFGLIAAWEEDAALDDFLRGDHPLAGQLVSGWHSRLEPLRVSGAWPAIPGLPGRQLAVADDEPVAVLTLGRPRLTRLRPFLGSARPAEAEVVGAPGLLASIGLARPPRLVSTFSLWSSAAAMRDYSYPDGGAHMAAVRADRERPFHHESAFIRFRPYASAGSWDGRDPLAAVAS
ncbi:MAG: spheroidene monooxygenase [Thermoleophilia bacterium]